MTEPSSAKIAFIGSHSVRKTNAVHSFAGAVGRSGRSVEVGREVVRFNPLGLNEGATPAAQLWVLMSQIQQELELRNRTEVLVTDRAVVDNYAYYLRVTGGEDPFDVAPLVRNWSATYDLHVRLLPDVPMIYDGVRSTSDAFRDEIEAILDDILPEFVPVASTVAPAMEQPLSDGPRLVDLTAALRRRGEPAKKEWWDRYLKGEIEFLGVPMAGIREAVHEWAGRDPDPPGMREAALALLGRPLAEEKLAGILIFQEVLLPAGAVDPDRDLPAIAARFDDGSIADWNTTDWLCVRVLGPLIAGGGRPVARQVADWVNGGSLWRRRAAAVSFVPIAAAGDGLFEGLADLVLEVCADLVGDPERFSQTAVGWLLRELSDAEPERVFGFLGRRRGEMSREAVRMAAGRLSDGHRAELGITGRRRRR
jgi:nicotinamide riboside kinase/3-methyladenine DNA glycosylase AlkD